MIIFNRTSRRFFLGFAAIVMGSIVIAFIAVYFSPESKQEKYLKTLQEQYANDTYGGETPEETLELFIQALEEGNVELASKYFVVEKQGEIREELSVGKENNNLDFLVEFLEKANRSTRLDENTHRFTVVEDQVAVMSFDLLLNTQTDKWKIEEL